MSSTTEKLGLFKYNTSTDGNETFNIDTSLNDNFDKIDANCINKNGTVDFIAEQKGVEATSPTGLTPLQQVQNLISNVNFPSANTANMPNLSNNSTNPNTQIDFSTGFCYDNTTASKIISTAMTKKLDAVFAIGNGNGGLDTGTKAINTWYHCFAISKAYGTSDFLFSLSVASPTMPSGFVNKRRIGSIKTNASGNICGFKQFGNYFEYTNNILLDINDSALGTSITTYTINVPSGISVRAKLIVDVASASYAQIAIGSGFVTDLSNRMGDTRAVAANNYSNESATEVFTNTSAQIKAISNYSGTRFIANTVGYTDLRGVN